MSSATFANRLIILAAISLPVAPVVADYFGPATTARWMLAQAANEFDQGNVAQAQKLLEEAYAKSPDLIEDKNFLKQVDRVESNNDSDGSSNFMAGLWEERIRRIENPKGRSEAAFLISSLLSNRKQFQQAARILIENLPPQDQRTPTQNNQIAYMRALAGSDLDQALVEIDSAIKAMENESFLDTKGWVLHRLGRNQEALEVMDKSLAKLLETWNSNSKLEMCLNRMNELQAQAGQEAAGKPKGWGIDALLDEFPELSRGLPEMLDMVATLHYHRLRICEALGKTDQVDSQTAWLHAFSKKDLDELY